MEIRVADKGDITVLSSFWFKLAEGMEQYSELNELVENAEEEAKDGFKELLQKEDYTIFILEIDGKPSGYMILQTDNRCSRTKGKYASIVDLFVIEEHRSQGYGTEMIKKAEKWANNQDCDYITVSAEWENQEARNFYEKNEFNEKQVKYAKTLDSSD